MQIDVGSSTSDERTLLVWDAEGPPPDGKWTVVLWSGFDNSGDSNVISIPNLVEEQADTLRSRYLAWIYDLGETLVNGKRLIDHLELRPGFSYWWMTSLAQRFNTSGTSQIENAIKTYVLERLVIERKITFILLVSNNDRVASTLRCFCKNQGIQFQRNVVRTVIKPGPFAIRVYDSLPNPVKAGIYFMRYLLKWLPLRCIRTVITNPVTSDVSFVDILTHLDKQAYISGKFISNYWTTLVENLLRSNIKTNWFHNYFRQESVPSLVRAQRLVQSFNHNSCGMQTHTLVETNLGLSTFGKALKDYLRLMRASYHVSKVKNQFRPAGSSLDYWSLFEYEWKDSLTGHNAMVNCLRISMYEKICNSIPHQKLGIYIQENQPWEMAFMHSWRSAGHGKLIGVPHTNVRFWDLRYFYDARSYNRTGKNDLPIPDLVAVNGPMAMRTYLEGGYPKHLLTEVEALRFQHLRKYNTANRIYKRSHCKILRVLICGDFLSDTNHKILSWIVNAAEYLPKDTTYIFKPHPAYKMNNIKFSLPSIKVSEAPLSDLYKNCDVVFTSNITSAAADAYFSGIPVVQVLDGATFNLSPLRNLKGVIYVTNPTELAEALQNAKQRENMRPDSYYNIDADHHRWHELLGMDTLSAERTDVQ